ncbi:hypothetical protein N7468_000327 [Penicillium chermesinum]|uniref:Uncharacterized protein n=1 Tax=Penicillium chermesinum TaxID=63820 RepID=A0A9W9PK36_9EURO|nr:uncharacterized protein N7468_000327 [Penicillium chermesinum]KAJ5248876.1 hypothetical protein N7468_000327 [Penicillium chermesinum]
MKAVSPSGFHHTMLHLIPATDIEFPLGLMMSCTSCPFVSSHPRSLLLGQGSLAMNTLLPASPVFVSDISFYSRKPCCLPATTRATTP